MNTILFVTLVAAVEAWIVWTAYCIGHSNGWCDGMTDRGVNRTEKSGSGV
jgi:hypothetical protein